MNKKLLEIKEVTLTFQENAGDLWYEEICKWIFTSSFSEGESYVELKEHQENDIS